MVRVEVIGEDALMAKFERSKAILATEKPNLLRKSALAIHSGIRGCIHEEFKERTGNLARSVRVFNQTKNGISIGTGKGLDYVHALEFGARPHEIVASGIGGSTRHHTEGGSFTYSAPGGASLLTFWWENAGMWFIGPRVKHPGNRPYRFIYKGTMDAIPTIYGYNREFLAAVLQEPV